MPKYGYKEHKSYREFVRDQGVWILLLWLFFMPIFLLALPWPEAAIDWRSFLLRIFLHILGVAILVALLALAIVVVACAVIWFTVVTHNMAGIPGAKTKIHKLTLRERLGRYIDFRGFG
ncbi:hypothetical protein MHFGQ_17090 [Moorella humiferrea]|jgi:hypothetical protein|uniref:Uncharacterized protein n=2 Tax=Neomoorella humiferrea TaxID=676965 RepID=A0A2T0AQZ6_9FIRM|nr:hypothetical protein MOHU_15710 [Moorella humiferrea]